MTQLTAVRPSTAHRPLAGLAHAPPSATPATPTAELPPARRPKLDRSGPALPTLVAPAGERRSREAPNSRLEVLTRDGEVETALRGGSRDRAAVIELQTFLHVLGFDDQLDWARYGADGGYGGGTTRAVRAYAERRGITNADGQPLDGTRVTTDLANALLRDVASVENRTGLEQAVATLGDELQARHPELHRDVNATIIGILAMTDDGEKLTAMRRGFARLDVRLDAVELSVPASEAWSTIAQRYRDSARRGDTLTVARVALYTYLGAMSEAVAANPDDQTLRDAVEQAEALFERLVLRDRAALERSVRALVTALGDDPAQLRAVLADTARLRTRGRGTDSEGQLLDVLRSIYRRASEMSLPAGARQALEHLHREAAVATEKGTLVPLARLTLAVLLDELDHTVDAGEDDPDLDARIAAMRGALAQLDDQGVTATQLRDIAPTLPGARAAEYARRLSATMDRFGITTHRQRAAFVAQVAHESGGFRYMRELGGRSYFAKYDGRRDLGNTEPGDGYRFRGRGLIQITGRVNYERASAYLYGDAEVLLDSPDLAAGGQAAFDIAGWFWRFGNRDINPVAEAGDFEKVTRRVNGGTNGLADRRAYYRRALAAL